MTHTAAVRPAVSHTEADYTPLTSPRDDVVSSWPRVELQRQGATTLSRHFWRALSRFLVLAAADLSVFLAMGWALRAVRDRGVLGRELSVALGAWVPSEYLGGLEFALALVVGLVATGNYGRGVKQKDAGRLFAGVALAVALTI